MNIWLAWIPGIMVGLEWDYELGMVLLDLFVFRICLDYGGITTALYTSGDRPPD